MNPVLAPTSSAIADWLELATFVASRRVISPASGRRLLEQVGGASDEDEIALAFGELHDRCNRGITCYPFRFSRLGLERIPDVDPTSYQFLLIVQAISAGTIQPVGASPSLLFEKFVRHAVAGLFGDPSKAIRFGHPPEPERPPAFADAVRWLAGQLNVRPLPLSGATLRRNDGGIDVIVWLDHGDGRAGSPVAAVQATYQGDLRGKSLEIAGNELDRWMDMGKPVPILATPVDGMDDLDLFDELSSRVLVLDRWRLLRMVESKEQAVAADVADWTQAQLMELSL